MKKRIPEFENEDQEHDFWASHDSSEYLVREEAKRLRFPDLKPSTRTISVRLPQSLLNDLKMPANKKDVPYQSLLKIYLAERIREELTYDPTQDTK